MTTTLIITDVTRMNNQRVCVAAVTMDGQAIRPILPNKGEIQEIWLYQHNEAVIRPFARVGLNLLRPNPCPPHTEDWLMDPKFKRFDGLLDEEDRERILEQMTVPCVKEMFHAEIHKPEQGRGHYVQLGEGKLSLGTLRPQSIQFVRLYKFKGELKYRLTFVDSTGAVYNLPVTDLSYRYYLDHLRTSQGLRFGQIGFKLYKELNQARTYLRIGLTRGHHPDENQPKNRCYLQVTGVYTFPDYLEGRCFADFDRPAL
ncbi:MAG TPA: hypothetical protein GYA06_02595 [Chloroflexi bacterium]|nr:hypothetical protein [Chloroflexota bacterium]